MQRLREIMGKLKLTGNEEKTRVCRLPEEEFDFLGYTFGQMYSVRTGKAYLGYRPSRKSIKRNDTKITRHKTVDGDHGSIETRTYTDPASSGTRVLSYGLALALNPVHGLRKRCL